MTVPKEANMPDPKFPDPNHPTMSPDSRQPDSDRDRRAADYRGFGDGFGDTDSDNDGRADRADRDTRRDGDWRHPAALAPVKDETVVILREYKAGKLASETKTTAFAVYGHDVIDANGSDGQLHRNVPRAGATPPADGFTWATK